MWTSVGSFVCCFAWASAFDPYHVQWVDASHYHASQHKYNSAQLSARATANRLCGLLIHVNRSQYCCAGVTQQNKLTLAEMRRQRLEALNDRRASKAMPKQASGQFDQLKSQKSADRALGPHDRTAESHDRPRSQGPAGRDAAHAAPSGLPSRDTSSSDSARAGQNGARAGLDKPHGRPTQSLRHAAAAGAAAKPVSKPADQVRGRLGRESPRSDTSTGAGTAPEGNSQRLAGPSRFGPGRAISRELPVEQEPNRLGKKRRFQVQLYPQICQLTTNVRHCRHLTLLFLVLVSRKSLSLSGCLPVSCAVLGRSQVSQE